MAQLRERLALAAELALRFGRVQAAAQHLQRNLLLHTLELASCPENRRRAAFAEQLEQFERADAAARRQRGGNVRVANRSDCRARTAGEQGIASLVRCQHALDARAHRGIPAVFVEKCSAGRHWQCGGRLEQFT